MLVTTSADYTLFVDGVAWVPTATDGESDVYAIASGGRFVFYDERGIVMFAFYNQYTGDFALLGYVNLYQLNSDGSTIGVVTETRRYAQLTTLLPAAAGFQVTLTGNYTGSPAASAEPSTNNGDVTVFDVTAERLKIVVTGGDLNNYTQIKLGNVLLAFATGRS